MVTYLHLDFSEEGGSSALALLRGPVEELTREAQMEEFMFLGLRMTKGISEIDFVSMFGVKIEGVYGPVIERLIGDGLLKREGVGISLTEWGMDLYSVNFCSKACGQELLRHALSQQTSII